MLICLKSISINNTTPNIPVNGYTFPTNFSNGNKPQKNAKIDMIIAMTLELYLPPLEILSQTVQKFGAAVEKIPHNSTTEKTLPNIVDIDFAKYKVGMDKL